MDCFGGIFSMHFRGPLKTVGWTNHPPKKAGDVFHVFFLELGEI